METTESPPLCPDPAVSQLAVLGGDAYSEKYARCLGEWKDVLRETVKALGRDNTRSETAAILSDFAGYEITLSMVRNARRQDCKMSRDFEETVERFMAQCQNQSLAAFQEDRRRYCHLLGLVEAAKALKVGCGNLHIALEERMTEWQQLYRAKRASLSLDLRMFSACLTWYEAAYPNRNLVLGNVLAGSVELEDKFRLYQPTFANECKYPMEDVSELLFLLREWGGVVLATHLYGYENDPDFREIAAELEGGER